MDDIIETMFLSLLYEGQFYSFAPVTQLDGSGLAIIRPLMYVGESDVKGFKINIICRCARIHALTTATLDGNM